MLRRQPQRLLIELERPIHVRDVQDDVIQRTDCHVAEDISTRAVERQVTAWSEEAIQRLVATQLC